jgi:hypothetical protein
VAGTHEHPREDVNAPGCVVATEVRPSQQEAMLDRDSKLRLCVLGVSQEVFEMTLGVVELAEADECDAEVQARAVMQWLQFEDVLVVRLRVVVSPGVERLLATA